MKKTIIILLYFTHVYCKNSVPVFIIDEDNILNQWHVFSNPFTTMKSDYFFNIVRDTQRSSCVIIFTEKLLSTEDISIKDEIGTPFKNFQYLLRTKKAKYIPSVAEPFPVLNEIFPLTRAREYTFETHNENVEFPKSLNYFYVNFEDLKNSTKAVKFRTHDTIAYHVYEEVKKSRQGPIVAFYVGKKNPINLNKMNDFNAKSHIKTEISDDMLISSKGALFRLSGLSLSTPSTTARKPSVHHVPYVAEEVYSRRSLSTLMSYIDVELQFNFDFEDKGWILDSVALFEGGEEVGRTLMRVSAPWEFSYVCAEPLVIINNRDGSTMTISKYQIQPASPIIHRTEKRPILRDGDDTAIPDDIEPTRPTDGTTPTTHTPGPTTPEPVKPQNKTEGFGKSVNCGPYFNSHILTGLVVTGVCMGILLIGLIMLIDCENNSKFDDPQGKEVITTDHVG